MKPLKITIAPTLIIFKGLTDEDVEEIKRISKKDFGIRSGKIGHYVAGTPKTLYNTLIELSTDFDIEL